MSTNAFDHSEAATSKVSCAHVVAIAEKRLAFVYRDLAATTVALEMYRAAAEKLARCACQAFDRNPDTLMDETGQRLWEVLVEKALRAPTSNIRKTQ